MANLLIKRVNSLPATLAASTMYIVKASDSDHTELYFTSTDGLTVRRVYNENDIKAIIAATNVLSLVPAASIPNSLLANAAVADLSGINTGDQTITLTGDVTGSGKGSFAATLSTTGVSAGTYGSTTQIPIVQVDAKGRVTSIQHVTLTVPAGSVSIPASPYDVSQFFNGQPAANETVLKFACVRSFTVPANFSASLAFCEVQATANAVFSIKKNGVQISTITFSPGSSVGVFSVMGSITFNIGDKITIVAPAAVDTTLADVTITLAGTTT